MEPDKLEKTRPVPCGPGGFIAQASLVGALTASGDVGLAAAAKTFEGPWDDNRGLTLSASSNASLAAKIEGQISAGGYLGAPFAHLALQGYGSVAATASAGFGVSGAVDINPAGDASGAISLTVPLAVELKASAGAKITYEALVASGEIAKWEFGSYTIGKAAITVTTGYDFGANAPIEDIKQEVTWLPALPPATLAYQRPMTPEEREKYQQQAKQEQHDRDGGSGSGAGSPREAHDE